MGKTVMDGKKDFLVSDRVATILFNLSRIHDKPMTAEEKYQAYKLCTRITMNPSEVELDKEESDFIKEACADALSSGAYGQVVDIIDNKIKSE